MPLFASLSFLLGGGLCTCTPYILIKRSGGRMSNLQLRVWKPSSKLPSRFSFSWFPRWSTLIKKYYQAWRCFLLSSFRIFSRHFAPHELVPSGMITRLRSGHTKLHSARLLALFISPSMSPSSDVFLNSPSPNHRILSPMSLTLSIRRLACRWWVTSSLKSSLSIFRLH